MPWTCPECGAVFMDDLTCQQVFDEFLVLEFTDPAYGAVHMLTVACFMIQHGRYSDDGLVWIEQKLRENLEKGVPAETIRRQAAGEAAQDQRTWKVIRQPGDSHLVKIPWSMTIAEVVDQYQDADVYQEAVKEWARSTIREMQPWLDRIRSSGQ